MPSEWMVRDDMYVRLDACTRDWDRARLPDGRVEVSYRKVDDVPVLSVLFRKGESVDFRQAQTLARLVEAACVYDARGLLVTRADELYAQHHVSGW